VAAELTSILYRSGANNRLVSRTWGKWWNGKARDFLGSTNLAGPYTNTISRGPIFGHVGEALTANKTEFSYRADAL